VMDYVDRRCAMVILLNVAFHAVRNRDHLRLAPGAIERMFQGSANRVENRFAEACAPLHLLKSQVPGAIANMGREYISTQAAETLAVNDIEPADLKSNRQNETQYGGQRVGAPRGNFVEVNGLIAIALDAVREYMYFVLLGEPGGQLGDISAVATGAMIVMHDIGDSHGYRQSGRLPLTPLENGSSLVRGLAGSGLSNRLGSSRPPQVLDRVHGARRHRQWQAAQREIAEAKQSKE